MSHLLKTSCGEHFDYLAVSSDRYRCGKIQFDMYLPIDPLSLSARAVVPHLLIRSSRLYPDYTALRRKLSSLYGATLSAGSSFLGDLHKFSLGIVFLDDRYTMEPDENIAAQCVELLMGMLFDPVLENGLFKTEDFELEKRMLIERIESAKNNKIGYAYTRCMQEMCSDEPFGLSVTGTLEQAQAITEQSVFEAWREIISCSSIYVTSAGSIDHEVIADKLRSVAASLDRRHVPLPETVIVANREQTKVVVERSEVQQAKLVIGYRSCEPIPSKSDVSIQIMTIILGGMSNSLLFTNVREKLSLCYYCSAAYNRRKKLLIIQSGIDEANLYKARSAINEQLEALCNGSFSDELFEQAKLAAISSQKEIHASVFSLLGWYSYQSFDDTLSTPEQYIDMINDVTRKEIVEAARLFKEDTVYLLGGKEGGEE